METTFLILSIRRSGVSKDGPRLRALRHALRGLLSMREQGVFKRALKAVRFDMSRDAVFAGLIVAWAAVQAIVAPARAADCEGLVQQFNQAVDKGQDADAQAAVDQIATDPACGRFQVAVQHRLAAFQLNAAQDLMARGRPTEEYERVLAEAARPGVLWQAAATLAEVRFGERRFAEAALGFDAAIEIVKNETATPTAPSTFEVQGLIDRASQARILSANGSAQDKAAFVATVSNKRDGKLGGFYSPSVRGIVPHAVALSITFDTNKASLTAIGEEAARELVRAVGEQQPAKVTVVGHTDVRGGPEYNLKLSEERARAVAAFMKANGVSVPIDVTGVGANEGLKIDDSAGLTQDDIYALNRRVEWRRE